MNQGAGAGREDDDLPLVDVVVPDDARDLFRDVLAYHREQRALRHRERWRRILAPLRRRGPILPLAIAILTFALVAGVVLTMLSPGPYFQNGTTGTAPAGMPTAVPDRLPPGAISVDGQPVGLRNLRGVALTLVPASCGCQAGLERLISEASQAKVSLYLIAPEGAATTIATLAKLAGAAGPGQVMVASDTANVLTPAFRPVGLTVLMVNSSGAVTVRRRLGGTFLLEPEFAALRGTGP